MDTIQSNIEEKLRCVIYTRINPKFYPGSAQSEREQREAMCRQYVCAQKIKLIGIFHDSVDARLSTPRPELQKVLGLAAQGTLDMLVLYNAFSLSPQPVIWKSLKQFLQNCGVKIICLHVPSPEDPEFHQLY